MGPVYAYRTAELSDPERAIVRAIEQDGTTTRISRAEMMQRTGLGRRALEQARDSLVSRGLIYVWQADTPLWVLRMTGWDSTDHALPTVPKARSLVNDADWQARVQRHRDALRRRGGVGLAAIPMARTAEEYVRETTYTLGRMPGGDDHAHAS